MAVGKKNMEVRRGLRSVLRMAILSTLLKTSTGQPNPKQLAAAVLFDQFETVFYSQLPLSGLPGRKLADRDLQALDAPFSILWYALKEVGEHVPGEIRTNVESIVI